jgi:hypothetical protein
VPMFGVVECVNWVGIELQGPQLDKEYMAFTGGLFGVFVGLGVSLWKDYKNRQR